MYELNEHEAYQVMSCFLKRWLGRVADVKLWPLMADEVKLDAEGDSSDPAAWSEWLECLRDAQAGMVAGNPLEKAPEIVIAMNRRLFAEGFSVDQSGSENQAIGDGRIDWRRGSVEIRAMRDALEWRVWIRVAGNGWFHPCVWHAFFSGALPSEPVVTDIDEKCRLTLAHLDDYNNAALQDPAQLREQLLFWRKRHYEAASAYWKDLRAKGAKGVPWSL